MSVSGLYRREMYVDARDLQSEGGEKTLSQEEYIDLLTQRGRSKLAENQLAQSFDATVRTVNASYQLGEDFYLGDTITVNDERLGKTMDAVVTGVDYSASRDGESVELIFGKAQPTVYDMLKRKAVK